MRKVILVAKTELNNKIDNFFDKFGEEKITEEIIKKNLVWNETNEYGRFFKISYNNRIVAYSWIWRAVDVLCFDNIEVTKEFEFHDNMEKIIMKIYKTASNMFIDISKQNEKKVLNLSLLVKMI